MVILSILSFFRFSSSTISFSENGETSVFCFVYCVETGESDDTSFFGETDETSETGEPFDELDKTSESQLLESDIY